MRTPYLDALRRVLVIFREFFMADSADFSEMFSKLGFFLPEAEALSTVSHRDKAKLPYLVVGTLVCTIMFFLLAASLFFQKFYMMSGLVFTAVAEFSVALGLVKKGRIFAGSYLSTAGLIVSCAIVVFFAPYYPTALICYRNAFFVVMMALVNQLVSFKRHQLYAYFAASVFIWIIAILTVFKPLYNGVSSDAWGNIFINSMALVIGNLLVMILNSFSFKITSKVEEDEKQIQEHLNKILAVVEESKEGLNIGQQLSESADTASRSLSRIEEFSRYLTKESSTLSSETLIVKHSGEEISQQASNMRNSVQSQTDSISQTSAAMTEMSSNIQTISKIASAQKTGMDAIVSSLESQRSLLSDLVQQVGNVKKSSDGISAFVSTIDDISSQTGLLAMNASIEAAHAGEYGKGFSVIAQEIRKLSEETTRSAAKISDSLKDNVEIVHSATGAVSRFATYMEQSAADMRTTLDAIEEILSGISEMSQGTQEVMVSLQKIVDESNNNAGMVDTVAEKIETQKTSLEHISGFATAVNERAGSLDGILMEIQIAIAMIQRYASENSIVGERISNALKD
jgi:methyl-accepting chemotaxis protein